MHQNQRYLRRQEAADYLKNHYGIGAASTLAKLASIGGGPVFQLIGRVPVYTEPNLDTWAQSRLSAPLTSTSAVEAA